MQTVRRFLGIPDSAPTGESVTVALLDTGVDSTHPDLQGVVDGASRDCTTGNDPLDRLHHGTHMAGIIAGRGSRNGGCYGIAPDVRLLSYKVVPAQGVTYAFPISRAVHAALENNADILVLALPLHPIDPVTEQPVPPPWVWARESEVERALLRASRKGVLCVVAAGNAGDGPGTIKCPGGSTAMLTVGSVAVNRLPERTSSRAPYWLDLKAKVDTVRTWQGPKDRARPLYAKPDLVTPGASVRAPHSSACGWSHPELPTDDGYVRDGGTSQATALAAGLAALALERLRAQDRGSRGDPNMPSLLHHLLCSAAKREPGLDPAKCGHGILRWPALADVLDGFLDGGKSNAA